MKLLFVNCPYTNVHKVSYEGDPMPLLYAINFLVKNKEELGLKIKIWSPEIWNAEVEKEFRFLLQELKPDLVGFSNTSLAHPYLLAMARIVRQERPTAMIISGGPHDDDTWNRTSGVLQRQLNGCHEDLVDFVFSGDADYALPQFIARAISATSLQSIKLDLMNHPFIVPCGLGAISFFRNGEILQNPFRGRPIDLNEIPSPYLWFQPQARYSIFEDSITANMMSSRGCRFHCNFCDEWRNFRITKDVHRVVQQMRVVIKRWGVRCFFWDDSVFFGGLPQYIIPFCNQAIAEGVRARWGCQLTVENLLYGDITEITQMLESMALAGCDYIYVGLESLADVVMTRVHKAQRFLRDGLYDSWQEGVREALHRVKRAGIRVGTSTIFGLPGETSQTIEVTIAGIAELISKGLVDFASANLLTYHPAAEITREDEVEPIFDEIPRETDPSLHYFEEAAAGGQLSRHLQPTWVPSIVTALADQWGSAWIGYPMWQEGQTEINP
jgi:radical SAM superfamily enzyme YgiQ (UPF0313 family)